MTTEPARMTPEQLNSQGPSPQSSSSIEAAAPQVRAEPPEATWVSRATPHSNVSAFCQAVISNLIPNRFWGEGSQGLENKDVIMRNIDRFVRLRRFENLSLHAVFQGLKVRDVESWELGSKLTRTVGIYDLVAPGSRQAFSEDCCFGLSEAQGDSLRTSLLCV